MIEATHGVAQSSHKLQSPEVGRAERVAWAVPAKGCTPPDERPVPNPIASRATRVSFMILPINIVEAKLLTTTAILDPGPQEASIFRSKFRHLPRR
jgi:hypothetical protein